MALIALMLLALLAARSLAQVLILIWRFELAGAILLTWVDDIAVAVDSRLGPVQPTSEQTGTRVANIKSQIKRNRTNEEARLRNKSVRSSVKTAVRRFRAAAESGDRDVATTELRTAARALDKAANKGVIHKNQAANKKSAMERRVNSL